VRYNFKYTVKLIKYKTYKNAKVVNLPSLMPCLHMQVWQLCTER